VERGRNVKGTEKGKGRAAARGAAGRSEYGRGERGGERTAAGSTARDGRGEARGNAARPVGVDRDGRVGAPRGEQRVAGGRDDRGYAARGGQRSAGGGRDDRGYAARGNQRTEGVAGGRDNRGASRGGQPSAGAAGYGVRGDAPRGDQRTPTAAAQSGSQIRLRVGQVADMEIKRMGINGEGIGYVERQVVFVDGALPGETVKVRIKKVEAKHAIGVLLEIVQPSKQRVQPPCSVYDQCGGCTLQHLSYEGQLEMKRELVRESFARYAKLPKAPVEPTVGMDDPWGYRNKAQLPIVEHGGDVVVGLYQAGSHRIVDVSGCLVQHPLTNRIVQQVRDIAKDLGMSLYDEKAHKGELRTVVARVGFETGECQLTLVTRTKELSNSKRLIERIVASVPEITSIMQNVNPEKTSIIFGEETFSLWGKEVMEEQLGDVQFSLSPRAFFQLNPEQTTKLYNLVADAAALTGNEVLVDAYCGVGTIGLWLAPKAREVHGMDIVPEAIEDAKRNAEKSGVTNARFVVGAAEKILVEWMKKGMRPDVVVVDPPRTGLAPELLEALLKTRPKKIVYVSCNPATLGKDCGVLGQSYTVKKITPVDMFPQTAHVECCSLLVRKENIEM
jgi:23S rRNA (uracil1939-C5)-methyltransferase